jgi:hypothetical protein
LPEDFVRIPSFSERPFSQRKHLYQSRQWKKCQFNRINSVNQNNEVFINQSKEIVKLIALTFHASAMMSVITKNQVTTKLEAQAKVEETRNNRLKLLDLPQKKIPPETAL